MIIIVCWSLVGVVVVDFVWIVKNLGFCKFRWVKFFIDFVCVVEKSIVCFFLGSCFSIVFKVLENFMFKMWFVLLSISIYFIWL